MVSRWKRSYIFDYFFCILNENGYSTCEILLANLYSPRFFQEREKRGKVSQGILLSFHQDLWNLVFKFCIIFSRYLLSLKINCLGFLLNWFETSWHYKKSPNINEDFLHLTRFLRNLSF